jgi:hypothetical protein
MMEAAQALAKQALATPGDSQTRLNLLVSRILSRSATQGEITVLQRELKRALQHYQTRPADAAKYLGQKTSPDLAAYTLVASLVLNLDEAITHE